MKKTIIILFIITQSTLSAQSVYDELIDKTQMVEQSQVMISQMLSMFAERIPDVPDKVWEEIQSEIDYQSFVDEIKNIFKKNYTEDEARELINTIDQNGINAITYKPEVTEAMYELGKKFGGNLGLYIRKRLKELGYIQN